MNRIRVYNEDEIKKLTTNPNVVTIRNNSQIIYSNDFKLCAVKEKIKYKDKTSRQIFEESGFDMNILDDRTPQKRLCSWMKKYKKFGEEYFKSNNKYSYKAKTSSKSSKSIFDDPTVIACVIERKDDGTISYNIVRSKDEKINYSNR